MHQRNRPFRAVRKGRRAALLRSQSPHFRVPRSRARLGEIPLVLGVPGRTAPHYTLGDSTPFRDLTVVRTHPVHRNGGEAPFFAVPGKAKPSRAEFGGDGAASPETRTPVAEHALFDQMHGVFDRRAPFHLASLYRRGVDHPHLPDLSTSVEEGAIARVFCDLELQSEALGRVSSTRALQQQKLNQPSTLSDPLLSTAPPPFGHQAPWRPRDSMHPVLSMSRPP